MKDLAFNHLSDEQIIHEILHEHKTEFFEIIYKRYFNRVKDKCYSFLKNRSLAEELANDIFSKVFEKLNGFQGRSSFSSWLYSISYNTIIDFLRKKKQLHYPNWNRENEIPEIIDETEADMSEINYENLMQIFELIHPEEKAILLMKYQDLLSLKDIAASLSISEDAVKMRLKRARSRVIYLYFEKFNDK
ncbi:MAG: RNA polymerase sigma factor [Prolixibacteraceae bacterium]|nr:RNA polymerase sigma factor [Prolixibacteraceae bacterium]